MKTVFQYCLFDLDGTLTEPALGITNSVMYALKKYDIHVTDRSELFPFIGPPLADSFKKFFGFSGKQAFQAVEFYKEYFRDVGIFEIKLYDGIPEIPEILRNKSVCVALATSKPYEYSIRILEHFDLYPCVFRCDEAIGKDDSAISKPAAILPGKTYKLREQFKTISR